MRGNGERRLSRTLRDVRVISIEFVVDDAPESEARTMEVRKLISEMIESSHRRGRSAKEAKEVKDAA